VGADASPRGGPRASRSRSRRAVRRVADSVPQRLVAASTRAAVAPLARPPSPDWPRGLGPTAHDASSRGLRAGRSPRHSGDPVRAESPAARRSSRYRYSYRSTCCRERRREGGRRRAAPRTHR
jgi:hypothetical protein